MQTDITTNVRAGSLKHPLTLGCKCIPIRSTYTSTGVQDEMETSTAPESLFQSRHSGCFVLDLLKETNSRPQFSIMGNTLILITALNLILHSGSTPLLILYIVTKMKI